MPKLSIIIPCYNEERAIQSVIKHVTSVKLPLGWQQEIVIVDDGSTDRTPEILKRIDFPTATVICNSTNRGKGAAIKTGFKHVTGDYVLIQDADLEYNPDEYSVLLQPIIDGTTTVVFGSRVMGANAVGAGHYYYYGGLLISKVFNALFGAHLTDAATCYKVFPRALVPLLNTLPSNDFVFDVIELTYALNKQDKIVEVPITYTPRDKRAGKKINAKHGIRCFWKMIRLRLGLDRI